MRPLLRRLLLLLLVAVALTACTDAEPDASGETDREAAATAPTPDPAAETPDADAIDPGDPGATEPPLPDLEPAPDAEQPVLEPGRSPEPIIDGAPALLVLGDSIAAGTGLTDLREGFAWRVHRAIADERGADYGLANLSVPGATSQSLLVGAQLADGLTAIEERDVDAVVLSVGGNDLLGLFRGACGQGIDTPECQTAIDEAVGSYAANLATILERLRAAAPDVPIVLLAVYNPFELGLGSQLEVRAAEAAVALNAAGAEVAAAHGAAVADGFAALEGRIAATTGMGAGQPDVHPTPLGHDRLAVTVLEALRLAR